MKQNYPGVPNLDSAAASPVTSRFGRVGALLLALGLSLSAKAQQPASEPFFRADGEARAAAAATPLAAALFHAQALTLDVAGLRAALATASPETQPGATPLVLALPAALAARFGLIASEWPTRRLEL